MDLNHASVHPYIGVSIHTSECPSIGAPMYGCRGTLRWVLTWVFFRLPMCRCMARFIRSLSKEQDWVVLTKGNIYTGEVVLPLVQLSIYSKLSCWKNRKEMSCFSKQLIKKLINHCTISKNSAPFAARPVFFRPYYHVCLLKKWWNGFI